jgi:hypothetical protein
MLMLALFSQEFNASITRATSLLIDDDRGNITSALQNGVRAVQYFPGKDERSVF